MTQDHSLPRRRLLKAGLASAAAGLAPQAFANTPPQLMRHAAREIILQFDVLPGQGDGVPASELRGAG